MGGGTAILIKECFDEGNTRRDAASHILAADLVVPFVCLVSFVATSLAE